MMSERLREIRLVHDGVIDEFGNRRNYESQPYCVCIGRPHIDCAIRDLLAVTESESQDSSVPLVHGRILDETRLDRLVERYDAAIKRHNAMPGTVAIREYKARQEAWNQELYERALAAETARLGEEEMERQAQRRRYRTSPLRNVTCVQCGAQPGRACKSLPLAPVRPYHFHYARETGVIQPSGMYFTRKDGSEVLIPSTLTAKEIVAFRKQVEG